jgi:hypothetical protein
VLRGSQFALEHKSSVLRPKENGAVQVLRYHRSQSPTERNLSLYVSNVDYNEKDIDQAVARLVGLFNVTVGEPPLMFSDLPPVLTIIEMGIRDLALPVIAAAIYDAVKGWITRPKSTGKVILRLRVWDVGVVREMEIVASDEASLKWAIDSLAAFYPLAPPRSTSIFDVEAQTWVIVIDGTGSVQ